MNFEFGIPTFGERPDRRRGRKQGGERVAAVGGGRRSKDRGHPPGTATGIPNFGIKKEPSEDGSFGYELTCRFP